MKFIFDDGGRTAAAFKGEANDCATRAVAIAAELPYAEVYKALADINAKERKTKRARAWAGKRSARNGVYTKHVAFKRYMKALGWQWTPTMQIGSGCKVHLRADELPRGRLIVSVSRHLCAVVDGVVHDTHDPSDEGRRCVYGYWSRADEAR